MNFESNFAKAIAMIKERAVAEQALKLRKPMRTNATTYDQPVAVGLMASTMKSPKAVAAPKKSAFKSITKRTKK